MRPIQWIIDHMAEEWYLVQFKPNAHGIADRNLKRQGFTTFLPMHETTQRLAARFVSKLRPLFPGYMFVQIDKSKPVWRRVNSTSGVIRIVGFGDSPAPVPPILIDGLLARCDEDGRIRESEPLETGQEVQVVVGPFSNYIGTVEKIESQQRVRLLLEFMGKETRIHLSAMQVSPTQSKSN